jgi:diguanylate cyclase (GGDEF)-like protein
MTSIDTRMLAEVLQQAPDGIAIAESRDGVACFAYVNATLAALLRLPEQWFSGRRIDEVEAEAPADPTLTSAGMGVRVMLRAGDGSCIDCERWTQLLEAGKVALYYRPVPRRSPGVLAAALDRSSGLATPEHFREVLRRDWSVAQREGRAVTIMRFDVDACAAYREVFGRGATDNVLRQVGRTIASAMRRASDVVAHFGEDQFVVLAAAMDEPAALRYAETILARIRALAIHHPRSPTGRYLTASVGIVASSPPRGGTSESILDAASDAVQRAKRDGGNRAVAGSLD